MKSLDEVIEEMQLKSDVNRHYREENADVLHYLVLCREYKKQMEIVEQIKQDAVRQRDAHIKALADLKRNEPLTWDELRSMEGKPVYVKLLGAYESYPNASRWMLVQSDVSFGNAWFIDRSRARYCFYEKDMNEIWQAYRKERL